MKKFDTLNQAKPVLVRGGFTEQDTWRAALGNLAPLHAFSAVGDCIDAPAVSPAGAMRATNYGGHQHVSFRD